jgi:hypothetical protein
MDPSSLRSKGVACPRLRDGITKQDEERERSFEAEKQLFSASFKSRVLVVQVLVSQEKEKECYKESKPMHILLRKSKSLSNPRGHSGNLLVERLGEGGGGSDVGIAGSLVGAGGLLQGLGISKVGGAVLLVGSSVVSLKVDVEKEGEHVDSGHEALCFKRKRVTFEQQQRQLCLSHCSPAERPRDMRRPRQTLQDRHEATVKGWRRLATACCGMMLSCSFDRPYHP